MNVLRPLFGQGQFGTGGLFTKFFASLGGVGSFGGFRAEGGPVAAGRGFIVGEKGPELFVPKMDGMIVPHGARLGGDRIVNNAITFHIETPDVAGFRRSEAQIGAMIGRALARAERIE